MVLIYKSISVRFVGMGCPNKRILVIDDELSVRTVIARYLCRRDFQVDLAADGEEGIRKFRLFQYDMVISDCHMPGPKITEVIKELTRLRPGIPILILSGLADPVQVREVLKAGATSFMPKPFELADLLRTINVSVQQSAISDQLSAFG